MEPKVRPCQRAAPQPENVSFNAPRPIGIIQALNSLMETHPVSRTAPVFEPPENTSPKNPSDAFVGGRPTPFGEPLPERQGRTAGFHPPGEVRASLAPFDRQQAGKRHFCDNFAAISASLFESHNPEEFFTPLRAFLRSSAPKAVDQHRFR